MKLRDAGISILLMFILIGAGLHYVEFRLHEGKDWIKVDKERDVKLNEDVCEHRGPGRR